VTLGVYDSTGSILSDGTLTSHNSVYPISLSLSPSGTFSGTPSGSTSSGTLTISSLRILSRNNFVLQATSSGLTSASSASFFCYNYVYTISLATTNSTPSANFDFTITASLFGEDSNPFLGTTTCTLSEASATAFSGSSSGQTSNGTLSYYVYFTTIGSMTMNVTCPAQDSSPAVSQTIAETVLIEFLKFSGLTLSAGTTATMTSVVTFQITVTVYNNPMNVVESLHGPYPVTLVLVPSGTLDGTVTQTTSSGTTTFTGLRVLSAGTFNVLAYTSGVVSVISIPLTVSNFPFGLSLSSPSVVSMNFQFTLSVSITSEDGKAYSSAVTLSVAGSSLGGTPSAQTSNGTAHFYLYFTATGSFQITASCAGSSGTVSNSTTVASNSLLLAISSFSPVVSHMQPTDSLTAFQVAVTVLDSTGTVAETQRGPYSVVIALSSAGVFNSSANSVTSNTALGIATFSTLRVISSGNYQIQASCASLSLTAQTASFSVRNYPYTISLSAIPTSPSANFTCSITATVRGEDAALYTRSVSLSLSEPTRALQGSLSGSTSTGSLAFSVFFAYPGVFSVSCSAPAEGASPQVTGTLSITVQALALLISSLTPTVRATQPSLSSSRFALTVQVLDHGSSSTEIVHGPYTITLTLYSTGSFSGDCVTAASTTAGVVTFSNLRILTQGSVAVVASCTNATSATSSTLSISAIVGTVTLTASTLSPTIYFTFSITVSLLAEDGSPFTSQCSVSISDSSSSLVGTTPLSTSTGQASFTFYFTSPGLKSISASAGSLTSHLSLSAMSLRLQVTSVSPYVI
jgi:hypothetical protein